MKKQGTRGFTLVELIVVIAIMGVLAAAGTIAYNGYVKSVQKKADIALVGNIERAIDSGAYAFDVSPKLQLPGSGIKIPVGFIVVTDGGVDAMQSVTSVKNVSKVCEIKDDIEFVTKYVKGTYTKGSGCNKKTVTYYYDIVKEKIPYCDTHSVLKSKSVEVGAGPNASSSSLETLYFIEDCKPLVTNHTQGHEVSEQIYDSYVGAFTEIVNNSDASLTRAMKAAFGDDFADTVKLSWSGWNEESTSIPTFYADADGLWEHVDDLSTYLLNKLGSNSSYIDGDYENNEELIKAFADKVAAQDEETFVKNWLAIGKTGTDQDYWAKQGHGLTTKGRSGGREFYCAARSVYNNAVASYFRQNGHADHAQYIADFSCSILGENLPATICPSAFVVGSTTKSKLGITMDFDSTLRNTDAWGCQTCKDLYAQYAASDACEANARAAWASFTTISQTADAAMNSEVIDFFDYYDAYLEEFSGLYSSINELTKDKKSCIVITVYSDGSAAVGYSVSPNEANPRKQ